MPPNQSLGWRDYDSEKAKAVPLPAKFKCRSCEKFKSPESFSNKQLNEYRFKKATTQNDNSVNAITAQLRCRLCSEDQAHELQCNGPCALHKSLQDFSKNARRRPEQAWCRACTQWKEANEFGVTPMPAPNSHMAPDEEISLVEPEVGTPQPRGSEMDSDSDDDDDDAALASRLIDLDVQEPSISPPTDSTGVEIGGYLPPHLRGLGGKGPKGKPNSESSVSNPYENRTNFSTISPLAALTDNDGWSTVGSTATGPRPRFYGANGEVSRRLPVATPSGSSMTQSRSVSASTSSRAGYEGPSRGGWARPAGRRQPPTNFPPASRPVVQPTPGGGDEEDDDDDY